MKSMFSFRGEIGAVQYVIASCALLVAHYLAQWLAFTVYEHPPLVYWNAIDSVSKFGLLFLFGSGWQAEHWPSLVVLIVDLVLAWLLLALAIRRARTVNRSFLMASLAIVPIIQIPTICWLGWSSATEKPEAARPENKVSIEVALKGLIAGLVFTLALEILSTLVFRTYGIGLFVASPFFIGCVTAYVGNRRIDIGSKATTRLVLGSCFLGAIGLMAIAVEGAVCLVMAAPLIALMAWLGGLVGRGIALKRPGATPGRTVMSIAVVPLFFVVDFVAPPHIAFESVESIEVAATDQQVWDAIVHMGPIPGAPAAPFRWGLAYPMSGTIHGVGVGAIREGVFSTGVAFERVTEWDPRRRLSFIVLSDPPTMHELSPYQNVNAPHVNGYFRTLDARFTITQLGNGRTLLSLATRHELDLSPTLYWLPIAKWAIHANKVRVLEHFAQQAEAAIETAQQELR